jgi:hypothetical protein
MSKIKVAVLTLSMLFILGIAYPVQAALTESQIQAVVSLITSFGADARTVSNVEASLRGTTPPNEEDVPRECIAITNNLYLGRNDDGAGGDVSRLQRFLKERGHFTYPTITGYFGPATERAVESWQSANGVVSSGSPETTGYGVVGPQTRARLAQDCSGVIQNDTFIQTTIQNPGPPSSVTVLYPNGGETIALASTFEVVFRPTFGQKYYINLSNESISTAYQLTPVGGNADGTVTGDSTQRQTVSVTIPNYDNLTPGNTYKIEICGGSSCDRSDSFITLVDQISSSPLVVLYPNGGEQYTQGVHKVNITWRGGDFGDSDTTPLYTFLMVVDENQPGFPKFIGQARSSSYFFVWDGKTACTGISTNGICQGASSVPPGKYRILVSSQKLIDKSDAPFLLIAPPTSSNVVAVLDATSPLDRELLYNTKDQEVMRIKFSNVSSGDVAITKATLDLNKLSGSELSNITNISWYTTSGIKIGTGVFDAVWGRDSQVIFTSPLTIPQDASRTLIVKVDTGIKIFDQSEVFNFTLTQFGHVNSIGITSTTDSSVTSNTFTLPSQNSTPSITVLSPNGGETWSKGTTQTIQWSDNSGSSCQVGEDCPITNVMKAYNIKLVPYYPPCTGLICPLYPVQQPYIISSNVSGSSYNWIVGKVVNIYGTDTAPDGQYTVQVCQTGTSVCDSSNSYFKIVSATINTPIISSIESKAAPTGTVYTLERAYIQGSGLGGKMAITIGNIPSSIQNNTNSYAEFVVPGMSAGSYIVKLTNSAGLVSNSYKVVVLNQITLPTVSISASPVTIISPVDADVPQGKFLLSWSSTNATSCNFEKQTLATFGSLSVPITSTATYTISCTGPGGTTTSNPVTVKFELTSPQPGSLSASRHGSSPSGYINVGTKGAELFKINLSGSGGNTNVTQLSFDLRGTAMNYISNIGLYDGSTKIASLSNLVNEHSWFYIGDMNVNLTIPSGTTKTLTVKGDVSPNAFASYTSPCPSCSYWMYMNLTGVLSNAVGTVNGLPVSGNQVTIPYALSSNQPTDGSDRINQMANVIKSLEALIVKLTTKSAE